MQQISSKQLKCYGRRNRAKPAETTTSSLESGPPAVGDVRGAAAVSEEVQAPAAASVQAVEVAVAQAAKPLHAGRGRPRKVVGAPNHGAKAASDVGKKKTAPTTRSSVGRLVAGEAREVATDPTPVEELVSEGTSLKTTPGQVQERVPVRVRIVGPFSNGGSKHGRSKSLGSGSPGSQKTRGQIARQGARRAADEETQGDGAEGDRGNGGGQAGRKGNGEWQVNYERGADGNAGGERKDAGEQVVGKGDEGRAVSERRAGGKHRHGEWKDAGEQVVERRDGGHSAMDGRAGGGREDAAEEVVEERDEGVRVPVPVPEKRAGGKSHRERKDAGEGVIGRRDGGQSVAEKRVGGKSHRESRDGGDLGQDREGSVGQGTLASRRRLLALQRRQREDLVLAEADDVLLKQEVRSFIASSHDTVSS